MMMTPFQRFLNGLYQLRGDFNEELDEIISFAEVMAKKQTCVELDENGSFYVSASGPLEEVIPALQTQLKKLERLKNFKDSSS